MQITTIWQLIANQAAHTPNNVAIVCGETQITYAELLSCVQRYAAYLQQQGVTSGMRVAILLSRDEQLIIAILAILACQAIYIPLDKQSPQQRHHAILQESNADFVISDNNLTLSASKSLATPGSNPVSDSAYVAADPQPQATAYIIFTSGSTGKPKGVMISHANAIALINWACATFSNEELAYTLAATSICFDLSVFEMFVPLAKGGCLVLVENGLSLLEGRLPVAITLINTVPSVARELVIANAIPKSVRVVNLAGESLPPDLVNNLYDLPHISKVYNLYGPSETTTYSTFYLAKKPQTKSFVPIGRPLAGTQILLLDDNQQPVAKMVTGEIYIAGQGVSQGYCNAPEEMAKRFVRVYIQGKAFACYRTGDIARINHEQQLEYLGRIDQQIKVRGFRIEPDEIIHVLMQHPAINQAFVMNHADVDHGQQLIAYLVLDKKNPVNNALLQAWLHERLPNYMVPKYLLHLEQLPLNANGKINRQALPLPVINTAAVKTAQTIDPVKKQLITIWQDLLGHDQFDLTSNFFYAGGHSLLAARLIAKILATMQVQLALEDIFHHSSINQQAEVIAKQAKQTPVFKIGNRPKQIPLSYNQQRLWYLQYADNQPISNIPIIITLRGDLNIQALEKSFTTIIERHEILRTTYHCQDQNLTQIIHEPAPFQLTKQFCDLAEANNLIAAEATMPFDLSKDSMLRGSLLTHAKDQHTLIITQHHIASDAWSLSVLVQELSVLYSHYQTANTEASLANVTQYADYAIWQQQHLTEQTLANELNFWRDYLQDVPATINLPYDYPRPEVQTYNGQFHRFNLPTDLVCSLQAYAHAENCSLFMVLLAAFNLLLFRYSEQTDLAIGVLTANRPFAELEHSLGFFVNTLVYRNQIQPGMHFQQYLQQVKKNSLAILAQQQLPFEQLVEKLKVARKANQHPLFQVLFSLQNALINTLDLSGLSIAVHEYDRGIAKFDLTLSLVESKQGLSGIWEYNTNLFANTTITRFAEHYQNLLVAVVKNPHCAISQYRFLSKNELALIQAINQTGKPLPAVSNLASLFQQAASKYPERIALQSLNGSQTYQQLDLTSNQLTHALRNLGIVEQSRVALIMSRSITTLTLLLAVIKMGASYVPIDPNWPSERIASILQDATIQLAITDDIKVQQALAAQTASIMHAQVLLQSAKQCSDEPIGNVATPDSTCYIMYTSGSTGQPKGVEIAQQGVIRLVTDADYFALSANNKILQLSPLVFDGSTFDIWGSLLHGATLILPPAGTLDIATIAHYLEAYQVDTLFITTALFNALIDYRLSALNSIKQLCFGGEIASLAHVTRFQAVYPECQLRNIYGPTECTTFALSYPITNVEKNNALPLGKPIVNTYAVILSGENELAPIGVSGEICLAGPGLAKGYLNQWELTNKKFIKNPIAFIPSEKLYRTGDIGRLTMAGHIDFLGRRDQQIKRLGHRIELLEIEKTLTKLTNIKNAVVTFDGKTNTITAYVLWQSASLFSQAIVRQALSQTLPEYMQPDFIFNVPYFPLNTNGKINKQALPNLLQSIESNTPVTIAVKSPHTATLVAIWQRVLEHDQFTNQDNFFEIGGNSLKIMYVLEELLQAYHDQAEIVAKLDITALFQYSTIEQLASYLAEQSAEDVSNEESTRIIRRKTKRQMAG